MTVKTMFGNQSATAGERVSVCTNISLNLRKRMYVKAKAMPAPIFPPMPPLRFFDDRATPMMVRMKAENGRANLVFFWMSDYLTLASPLSLWVSMRSFNSK